FVGGPFEGLYRNASIVHDTECDLQVRAWRDVHRMFYNGMRAGGVGRIKAMLMYAAVYRFGPRWKAIEAKKFISRGNQQDYLRRLLVVWRRDYESRELAAADLERKSYEELLEEVPDTSAELDTVRELLAKRVSAMAGIADSRDAAASTQSIDDQLYLE